MKILYLADAGSIHTQRWVKAISENGNKVLVVSYRNAKIDDIPVMVLRSPKTRKISPIAPFWSKFHYLFGLKQTKNIIKKFQPDIVHAFWATSYGLLGARCDFHPFIISVWGSDVFDFPNKSFLHKKLLQYNLKSADKLLSTSKIMANEILKYTNKKIEVTPFGIDLEKFKPMDVKNLFKKQEIVIGTVKTLEEKYGIEYLIKAFKILSDKYPKLPLKLLIVGGGSLKNNLNKLTKKLEIEDKTIFTGNVNYDEIPKYHNMLSVSVSISNSESFGVAIIEASACEKPVVVSNVGGLPEVVEDKVTGFIVPKKDPVVTAKVIEKLIIDQKLRRSIGKAGRKRVEKLYNWDDNVKQMINIYNKYFTKKTK